MIRKFLKSIFVVCALTAIPCIAFANTSGEEKEAYSIANTSFVSSGLGINAILSNSSNTNVTLQSALSYGYWFTPVSAISIDAGIGTMKLSGRRQTFQLGATYMLNILNINREQTDRDWDLFGLVGGDVSTYSSSGSSYGGSFSNHIGLQVKYNITPKVGIFFQPKLHISNDLVNGIYDKEYDLYGSAIVGLSVNLGSSKKSARAGIPTPEECEMMKLTHTAKSKEQKLVKEEKLDSVTRSELTPIPVYRESYMLGNWNDNTFVSGMVGGSSYLNRSTILSTDINPVLAAQYGKWISPLFIAQANLSLTKLNGKGITGGMFTVEGMMDVSNAIHGYNPNRLFSFRPFIGVGASSFIIDSKDEQTFSPVLTAGLRGAFNVHKNIDLFVEGRSYLHYNESSLSSSYTGTRLPMQVSVGITYNFNKVGFTNSKNNREEKVAALKKRISELDEIANVVKEDEMDTKYALYEDNSTAASVTINFESYSSVITDTQQHKVDRVGEWLSGNKDASIEVTALYSNEYNRLTMIKRVDAICNMLKEEYGVTDAQINVIRKESNAVNVSDVVITFIK